MKANGLIDLHCDTLTDFNFPDSDVEDSLNDPQRAIAFSKMEKGTKWAQLFALFIPDDLRGQDAIDFYNEYRDSFQRQIEKFSDITKQCRSFDDIERAWENKKFASIFSVEGGSALAGDMDRVGVLADDGVKSLTLVWNGENEIGSGNTTENGLSDFGKKLIPELEKHNIIIDVSHLNDQGFYDLLEVAKEPFIASHSNSRTICNHKRNLTDDQIKEIVKRDGLIGLNYFTHFITEDGKVDSMDDLYAHIEHFISLGAEKHLALGSDYDGADVPEFLDSIEKSLDIYDYLISKGLSHEIADGIMFQNAYDFFRKNLK